MKYKVLTYCIFLEYIYFYIEFYIIMIITYFKMYKFSILKYFNSELLYKKKKSIYTIKTI